MTQESGMYGQTRLHKRGAVYYFRAAVPRDLRKHYGKREICYSLRTKERAQAERLVRKASVALDEEFTQLRQTRYPERPREVVVTDGEVIDAICARWRQSALEGDEWRRSHGLSDDEYREESAHRLATLDVLREALAKGRVERVQPALEQFLMLLGIKVAGDPEKLRELSWAFLKVVTETHLDQIRRDKGEIVPTPKTAPPLPVKKKPGSRSGSKRQKADADSLRALYDHWLALVPGRPVKTVEDFRRVVEDFDRHCGGKPASAVTRGDVFAYRDHLLIKRGLHHKTVGKRLSYLSAVFQVAVDAERLLTNPAARIKVPRPKVSRPTRVPLDLEDIKSLFASPIYAERKRPRAGGGEAAAWLPVLGLYTGCRLEELGQLRVADVQEKDGIPYLSITDNADGEEARGLKTEDSRRQMPIHPELVKAGFLDYVKQLKGEGQERLFPGLKADRTGKITGNWSKWWGRYRRTVKGIDNPAKPFHSLRHTFRDACREAEIHEELADALMGHAGSGMGRRYGSRFSLRQLYGAICRIDYPGIQVPYIGP